MNAFQRHAQMQREMLELSSQSIAYLWHKLKVWWNPKRYGSPMADVVGAQQNINAFQEMQMAYLKRSAIKYDSRFVMPHNLTSKLKDDEWPEILEDNDAQ